MALPKEVRKLYAEAIKEVTVAGSRILMVTFQYDQAKMNGPPFSVTVDEVRALFGDQFDIEVVQEFGFEEEEKDKWKSRGLDTFDTSVLLLVKRE